MQRGQDAVLLYATLVLAVMAAILSCTPVRRAMDTYFASSHSFPGDKATMVIGSSMTEDPADPAKALDWRIPLGN